MSKNDLNFSGKVVWISEEELIGQNSIPKKTVVLKETEGEYPCSLAIDFFGDKISVLSDTNVDDEVTIYYNMKANKNSANNRVYTNIKGRKVEKTEESTRDHHDNLPF